MGVIYCDEGVDMEANAEERLSLYVRGKQIMPVHKYVKEINELRIASKRNDLKGYEGKMLPVVLVERCSPALIKESTGMKHWVTPTKTSFEKNGVIESSEEEEESVDDPGPVTSENPPSPPKQPSKYVVSEESEYEDDSEELPNLSDSDPPYSDRPLARTPKKKVLSPQNKIKKFKKKSMSPPFSKIRGHLMKNAMQTCMEKQKMFATSSKNKRLFKGHSEPERMLPSTESHEKPSHSQYSYKHTELAQLKPNAKSPKDVERGPKKDSIKQQIRNELRAVLQMRLQSPPREREPQKSQERNNLDDLSKTESSVSSDPRVTAQEDDNEGYDSDATVTYEGDIQQRNREMAEKSPSEHKDTDTGKRKNADDPHPSKKLKGSDEVLIPFVSSGVLNSPPLFGIVNEGDQEIRIADIQGGVTDAFEKPQKTTQPSSSSSSGRLRIQQLSQKHAKRSECDKQIAAVKEKFKSHLMKEKQDHEKKVAAMTELYHKKVAELTNQYNETVSRIEKEKQNLEAEIEQMFAQITEQEEEKTNSDGGNDSNTEEDSTARIESTMPVIEEVVGGNSDHSVPCIEPEPVKTTQEKSSKGAPILNIISAARISQFGGTNEMRNKSSDHQQKKREKEGVVTKKPRGRPPGKSKSSSVEKPEKVKSNKPVVPKTIKPNIIKTHKLVNPTSSSSNDRVAQNQPPPAAQNQHKAPPPQPQPPPSAAVNPSQSTPEVMVMNPAPSNTLLTPQSVSYPGIPPVPLSRTVVPPQPQQFNVVTGRDGISMIDPIPALQGIQVPQMLPFYQDKTVPPGQPQPPSIPSVIQTSQPVQLQPNAPPVVQVSAAPVVQAVLPLSLPPGVQPSTPSQIMYQPPSQLQSLNQGRHVVITSGVPAAAPPVDNARNAIIGQNSYLNILSKQSIPSSTAGINSPLRQIAPRLPMTVGSTRPQKSHLLVTPQPSASSSGIATQVRSQPPSSVGGATPLPTSTKSTTNTSLPSSNIYRSAEVEENSPEAEQSCFLCGSPGEFVCCNSIVYCSQDCKSKDWSRHKGECTRKA